MDLGTAQLYPGHEFKPSPSMLQFLLSVNPRCINQQEKQHTPGASLRRRVGAESTLLSAATPLHPLLLLLQWSPQSPCKMLIFLS